MREETGDLWTWDDGNVVARVITTNGFVTEGGSAVLGRGVAKQAVDRFGEALKVKLGERLLQYGNHVHAFKPNPEAGRPYWLLTFPVKPERGPTGEPGWKCDAELGIIVRSARELLHFYLGALEGTVVLPRPGCGNGRLDWDEVRPHVAAEFSKPIRGTCSEEIDVGNCFVVVHP